MVALVPFSGPEEQGEAELNIPSLFSFVLFWLDKENERARFRLPLTGVCGLDLEVATWPFEPEEIRVPDFSSRA